MDTKTTQLEKNTANALDSFDPFANLVMPFRRKKKEQEEVETPKESVKKQPKVKAKPEKKPRLEKVVPPKKEDIVEEVFESPIIESRTGSSWAGSSACSS